jgi:hypothetical protein
VKNKLQKTIEHVDHMLKRDLNVGDVLTHRILGQCTYTDECEAMEVRNGSAFTLFVNHKGDVKEVTLRMMEREIDGHIIRFNELTPRLEDVLQLAKARCQESMRIGSMEAMIILIKTELEYGNRHFDFK